MTQTNQRLGIQEPHAVCCETVPMLYSETGTTVLPVCQAVCMLHIIVDLLAWNYSVLFGIIDFGELKL